MVQETILLQAEIEALPPRPLVLASRSTSQDPIKHQKEADGITRMAKEREISFLKANSSNHTSEMDKHKIFDTILAWDQIGSLSSDIASSCIAKQAAMISEQFRHENDQVEKHRDKRRKVSGDESDETASTNTSELTADSTTGGATGTGVSGVSAEINKKIDRMARMSKLALEMQSYHRRFQAEMMELAKE
jgi:hypothetical protein